MFPDTEIYQHERLVLTPKRHEEFQMRERIFRNGLWWCLVNVSGTHPPHIYHYAISGYQNAACEIR